MRRLGILLLAVLLLAGCPAPSPTPQRAVASPFPSALPTRTPPAAGPVDGSSQPVADPVYPEVGNPAIDVLRYELALDWRPDRRVLTGTATLRVRMVLEANGLRLDLASPLGVTQATIDGVAVSAGRQGERIVLPAGRQLAAGSTVTVVVRYTGTPSVVRFPGVRKDVDALGAHIGKNGELWSMQEPFGAYSWYPCSDQPSDKALYDVSITTPTGWTGVTSGRFAGSEPAPDGSTTARWHATEPIASYLVALAVDRFKRHDLTGPRGVPITLWVHPDDEADMLPLLRETPDLLGWLERHFGPYPFASAGVVVVDDPSAMETQTMVTMGQLTGRRGVSVLLHELAHQWFGDAVTPRTWQDVWLNEGFASYVELLFSADRFGVDVRDQLYKWLLDERETRVRAGPAGRYDRNQFGEHNVYFGPALMLHEMRRMLGEQSFFAMVHDWVQHHRFTNQDRVSFTKWVSDYTGRDMSPVVTKWLDSPTVPAFPD